MKFTRDPVPAISIRQIEPDSIRIGDERVTASIVLTPTAMIRDWFPANIESLSAADLDTILALEPDIVVIGSGRQMRRQANDAIFTLARQGIGLEMMDTAAACRTFNILVAEGRAVVALLSMD